MKDCPKCGAPVDDNASYCTACGASLVPQMNNSGTQMSSSGTQEKIMSSSGTQEKILYMSSLSLRKIIGIILLILAIAGIITGFILLFSVAHYGHYSSYYGYVSRWDSDYVMVIILSAFLPAVVLGVVGTIFYLLEGKCRLVITDCRVYVANNKMVKRINIPVDSITVWGARWRHIFVGNSAGRIVAFINKEDRNAFCSILENLLIERQNSMSPESSDVY